MLFRSDLQSDISKDGNKIIPFDSSSNIGFIEENKEQEEKENITMRRMDEQLLNLQLLNDRVIDLQKLYIEKSINSEFKGKTDDELRTILQEKERLYKEYKDEGRSDDDADVKKMIDEIKEIKNMLKYRGIHTDYEKLFNRIKELNNKIKILNPIDDKARIDEINKEIDTYERKMVEYEKEMRTGFISFSDGKKKYLNIDKYIIYYNDEYSKNPVEPNYLFTEYINKTILKNIKDGLVLSNSQIVNHINNLMYEVVKIPKTLSSEFNKTLQSNEAYLSMYNSIHDYLKTFPEFDPKKFLDLIFNPSAVDFIMNNYKKFSINYKPPNGSAFLDLLQIGRAHV